MMARNKDTTKKDTIIIEKEGLLYCKSNSRLVYDPEFHENHFDRWTKEEVIYLVNMKGSMSYRDIGMALGRTEGTCASKYCHLKKTGKLDYYKNLG